LLLLSPPVAGGDHAADIGARSVGNICAVVRLQRGHLGATVLDIWVDDHGFGTITSASGVEVLLMRKRRLPDGIHKIKCRDADGRRCSVLVSAPAPGVVVIVLPSRGVAQLSVDQVNELRATLRNALLAACEQGASQVLAFRPVRCLDATGCRRTVRVHVGPRSHVELTGPTGDVVTFAPLRVGSLRGALRDVIGREQGGEAARMSTLTPTARRLWCCNPRHDQVAAACTFSTSIRRHGANEPDEEC
jgi:hypothetical protein